MQWKKVGVFIALDDEKLRKQCIDVVNKIQDVELLGVASSGEEAYFKIRKSRPDIVICEVIMSGMDGYTLLSILEEELVRIPQFILCYTIMPKVLATMNKSKNIMHYIAFPMSDRILERQINTCVEHYLKIKCAEGDKSIKIRKQLLLEETTYKKKKICDDSNYDEQLERIIKYELEQIGLDIYCKGFPYVVVGICEIIQHEKGQKMRMMAIYSTIGKRMNVSVKAVERAMRICIKRGWEQGNVEYIKQYWGIRFVDENNRPTNSHFMYHVAAKIARDYVPF